MQPDVPSLRQESAGHVGQPEVVGLSTVNSRPLFNVGSGTPC
jgi:hypothetical protein